MKTRDIILERKMETRMRQKCHAARDNTTPLMRKVPESEGDRMRSALQEVLVSGWVGRPESSAIYKASSRMSHLTPVKWLLMRLLETRAGHHSAVYTD